MGAGIAVGRGVRAGGRWTRLLVLILVLGLLATACGQGEEESSAPADGTNTGESTPGGGASEEPEAAEDPDEASEAPAEASEAPAEATEAGSCYDGETVTFVVSFGAGGGYDQIARLLAPALEEELGATVVVENQPGAGGLLAMNSLLTSEPDGLRFGFFTGQGITGAVLGGAEGADFNLLDFTFLGRVAADRRVLVTGGSSPLQTIDDVLAAGGLRYATAGPGASDYIDATVLSPVLELETEIITGYEGSEETELAAVRGDVDLASGTVGSRSGAIDAGDLRALLALGSEPLEDYPDVPTLTDLELSEENLEIAEAYDALQEMGRMLWAPPGVPEECAAELEDAFATVLADPEVVGQMEAADQEIDFASGEEMRAVAQGLLEDAPESFTQLLAQAYEGQ